MQRRGFPPLQMEGTALTGMGTVFAVRLPSPWLGEVGEEVVIITGEPGSRLLASGALVQARASVASFELKTRWKPLDLRTEARYPASLSAEVRSVLGNSRQAGTIIDVSPGGMAVEVPSKPGGREVAVVTQAGAYAATLPCEIVKSRPVGEAVVLNLKFRDLTSAQQAFVKNIVAAAQAQALGAQSEAS